MAYVPTISSYKRFLIQTTGDNVAWDTRTYGLIAKSNPYPILPEAKDVYNNDWKDEDGDDEYNVQMVYKAFEFDVSFYVKTYGANAEATLRGQMRDFFDKIRRGEFKVYDEYTGLGFTGVRYKSFKEEEFKARKAKGSDRSKDWARCIFSVTFKVNDPTSRMAYSNNIIVSL